ncbi:hypothetical protein HPP92_028378 [Vanilla planifolia]|uniref:CW-type domain-containing protein n=1 Tax=Vanilla planifolia TaxID=51239 RepID=A0A835P5W6_VANPL|nr:hypothetical protein HPP92_028378 [Vanilla planifolia]
MPMRPDSEDESTVVDREKSQGIAVVESSSVQFSETVSNQLVVYNPGSDHIEDQLTFSNQIDDDGPTPLNHAAPNPKRVLPSVGAFTVQCASCFKWRLIPTKEKYEQIRENISQIAFVCNSAREWRPDVSCDDPPDILQDENRLWAIDKPNIAQPPPGWDRQLRIRGEGSTRFADVWWRISLKSGSFASMERRKKKFQNAPFSPRLKEEMSSSQV